MTPTLGLHAAHRAGHIPRREQESGERGETRYWGGNSGPHHGLGTLQLGGGWAPVQCHEAFTLALPFEERRPFSRAPHGACAGS